MNGQNVDLYQRARTRAARSLTVMLRRRERRLVQEGRAHRLSDHAIAELAAIRVELRAREGRARC